MTKLLGICGKNWQFETLRFELESQFTSDDQTIANDSTPENEQDIGKSRLEMHLQVVNFPLSG